VTAHAWLVAARESPSWGRSADAGLTRTQDAVRLAACAPDRAALDRLAAGSGRSRTELDRAVQAWRFGGADGLSVLEEEWPVEAEAHARACAVLATAWEEDDRPSLRAAGNRWTVVGAERQLRLGRDGLWWPFRMENGHWALAGGPNRDPATALATAEVAADQEGEAAEEGR
jgi:hypothetical protein